MPRSPKNVNLRDSEVTLTSVTHTDYQVTPLKGVEINEGMQHQGLGWLGRRGGMVKGQVVFTIFPFLRFSPFFAIFDIYNFLTFFKFLFFFIIFTIVTTFPNFTMFTSKTGL